MNIKKLASTHGPLTQVTLTEFEKCVFISLVKKASIPFISDDIKSIQPEYDQMRVGHVLQTFLRGVK